MRLLTRPQAEACNNYFEVLHLYKLPAGRHLYNLQCVAVLLIKDIHVVAAPIIIIKEKILY